MASLNFFVKSVKKSAVSKYAELIGQAGSSSVRGNLLASQHGNMPSWAANDSKAFWRAAFKHERQNGSVFRVYDIELPDRLSVEQNLELSNRYIHELASNKPYQGELVNVRREVRANPSLHLRLIVSERVEDASNAPRSRRSSVMMRHTRSAAGVAKMAAARAKSRWEPS